jgi:hypothetical protein
MKTVSDAFASAFRINLAIQIIGGLICSTVLDGGKIFTFWIIACVGYWIGFGFIRFKRPQKPSKIDIVFLSIGTFILFLASAFIFGLVAVNY